MPTIEYVMTYIRLPQDSRPASAASRCVADLNEMIGAFGGTSLLVICDEGDRGLVVGTGRAGCRIDVRRPAGGGQGLQGRYDVAVVYRVSAILDREEFINLVSSLRDVHASLLLVVRAEADCPGSPDLVQLGLRRYGGYRAAPGDVALEVYGFCMKDYKVTPAWLNNRHWANPELWGKFRW